MSDTTVTTSDAVGAAGGDNDDTLLSEILEVLDSSKHFIDLEAYLSLRRLGGTHAGIVAMFDLSCPMGYIAEGLEAGVTAEEMLEVGYPWQRVGYYTTIRQSGQSHADALEAVGLRIKSSDYVSAVEAGATHVEIVEFDRSSRRYDHDYWPGPGLPPRQQPTLIRDYARARGWGISHAELLDGLDLGISPELLSLAGQHHLPYGELAAAVRGGANPLFFIVDAPKRI